MSTKSKQSKGKKKGGMVAFMAALIVMLSAFLALPVIGQANDFTVGLGDIPTRVTAGYTLSGGLSDPGEGAAIGLNNLLSVISDSLKLPGLVVSWRGERVLELGAFGGGYSGQTGNDATTSGTGAPFIGVGGYLLEYIYGTAIYRLDSSADHNYQVFAGVDVARLGPKLVSLTSAAWHQTGL